MSTLPIPSHFSPLHEVHILISTNSGSGSAAEFCATTLLPTLAQRFPHLEPRQNLFTHTTTSAASITLFTLKTLLPMAKKGVKATVILLSGDGGVSDLMNTLATTLMRESDDWRGPSVFFKPIVCVLEFGTANALGWSAGLFSKGDQGDGLEDGDKGLQKVLAGRARALPMFEVKFSTGARVVADEGRERKEFIRAELPGALQTLNDIDAKKNGETGDLGYYDTYGDINVYGCVVFSWGLHASLVALSDTVEMRKHGVERFKMAAGKLLEEGHSYRGIVKYKTKRNGQWQVLQQQGDDVETGSTDHKYILATQVSNLEEKFCISPQSKPMDGSLHLVAIGDQPSEKIMQALTLAYQQGQHIEQCADIITYQEIDSLRIEFKETDEKWRQVCIDGKIVAIEDGGWVEIREMPAIGVDGRRVIDLVC